MEFTPVAMKFSLVISAFLVGSAADVWALTNKVLIIGVDGTMNSALAVARTPNLDALKSNGCKKTNRTVTNKTEHELFG